MAKENRWGSVNEIDRRTKVGSASWKARHPQRIQHLSAYRRLHDITDHAEAREYVDAPVSQKLAAIKRIENREKK